MSRTNSGRILDQEFESLAVASVAGTILGVGDMNAFQVSRKSRDK
jgi:hypothetical protein